MINGPLPKFHELRDNLPVHRDGALLRCRPDRVRFGACAVALLELWLPGLKCRDNRAFAGWNRGGVLL